MTTSLLPRDVPINASNDHILATGQQLQWSRDLESSLDVQSNSFFLETGSLGGFCLLMLIMRIE